MPKTIYRYPQKSDAAQLLEFINTLSAEQTYIRMQGKVVTLEEEEKYLNDFLKNIKDKKAIKILAFDNEQLVGAADINMGFGAENHVGVFGITVAKSHRGQGIGSELMSKTIDAAKTNIPNLEIITLGVFADNTKAILLYQKYGFKQYGILPNGAVRRGIHSDHIQMYLEV